MISSEATIWPADFLRTPETLDGMIRHRAELSPERVALVDGGVVWTYAKLAAAIDGTEAWLSACHIRAGDRVILVSENGRAAVVLLFAASALGAWPIVVSARISQAELNQIREHSGARRVFYTVGAAPRARTLAERDDAVMVERDEIGMIGVGRLNEQAAVEPQDDSLGERIAALVYTSGTTGTPKGVMLRQRNLLFVAAASGAVRGLTLDDRVYVVLPISHILGLTGVVLASLMFGAALYLAPRFDPAQVLTALERDRISFILGTPAMYALLVEYTTRNQRQVISPPALRLISSAGAPLDPATKQAAESLFGRPLYNGYGITECGPTVSLTPLDLPRTDCAVGRLLPGIEAKLMPPGAAPVGANDPGELWLRGPGIMKGYYRAPEETALVLDADGWFNTRDLARLEQGDLFIVGRTKELIIRFGFNVYPAEIEATLNAHPAVAQSAVVARRGENDDEIVAFVQLNVGVSADDLMDYAAERLAVYKRPSEIVILETLPATPAGKILKQELVQRARAN